MNLKNTLIKFTAVTAAAVCFISFYSLPDDSTVFAADYTHSSGQHSGWKVWTKPSENKNPIFSADGKYYLNGSVDFSHDKTGDFNLGHKIAGNIGLCLNGNNLSASSSSRGFVIESGTVNIYNCQSTKSSVYANTSGCFVFSVSGGAKLVVENCKLSVGDNWCIDSSGCFTGKNCEFSGKNAIKLNSTITEPQKLESSTVRASNEALNISGSAPVDIVSCTIHSDSNNGININNGSVTVSVANTNISSDGDNKYGINCNGNLKLSGNNTITGKNAGIYLGANKKITITGNLTNDTPISIDTAIKPTDEAPVVLTDSSNTNLNDPNKFVSADNKYRIVKDPLTGQLQLTTGAELHSMSVSYNVEPSYTVEIPATVNLSQGQETKNSISVQDVSLEKGHQVAVSLTAATPSPDDKTFHVQSNSNKLDYTIKINNKQVKLNDKLLSVTCEDGNGKADLTFSAPSDITFAGTYTGTLTFTFSVS